MLSGARRLLFSSFIFRTTFNGHFVVKNAVHDAELIQKINIPAFSNNSANSWWKAMKKPRCEIEDCKLRACVPKGVFCAKLKNSFCGIDVVSFYKALSSWEIATKVYKLIRINFIEGVYNILGAFPTFTFFLCFSVRKRLGSKGVG